ncbi:hypothetical protein WCLP8_4900003 [uncultured Gammaproteobacteria bacterium]
MARNSNTVMIFRNELRQVLNPALEAAVGKASVSVRKPSHTTTTTTTKRADVGHAVAGVVFFGRATPSLRDNTGDEFSS